MAAIMLTAFIAVVLRCFTAMLLAAAVAGKLRSFSGFRSSLADSLGLGAVWSKVLAPAVVAGELLAAVMIVGPAPRSGMLAALAMFAAFTAFIGYKYFTQSVVRCSCFGASSRPVSGYDLLRNLLVIIAILAWLALAANVVLSPAAFILACGIASVLCVAAIGFHDIAILIVRY